MTIAPAYGDIPPRAVFAHNETLHAIILPPLALFLTSLRDPDHLTKLNDILERYRTPKSYHRVDVREVAISDVPGSAREVGLDEGDLAELLDEFAKPEAEKVRDERVDRDAGRPIVLPDGMSVETWRGLQGELGTRDGDQAENLAPVDRSDVIMGFEHEDSLPATMTAPRHRVRELRLDLRTLDAAALFALETWRREILDMPKLELSHPDSVWFKEPTPSPTPPAQKAQTPKKRGRPSKASQATSSMLVDGDNAVTDGFEVPTPQAATAVDSSDPLAQHSPSVASKVESPVRVVTPEGESEIDPAGSEAEGLVDQGEDVDELDELDDYDVAAVLPDMHDANDEADPDFEPEPEIVYTGRPRGRPSKEAVAARLAAEAAVREALAQADPVSSQVDAQLSNGKATSAPVGSWANPARLTTRVPPTHSGTWGNPVVFEDTPSPTKRGRTASPMKGSSTKTASLVVDARSGGPSSRRASREVISPQRNASTQGRRRPGFVVEMPAAGSRQKSRPSAARKAIRIPSPSKRHEEIDELDDDDPFSFKPPPTVYQTQPQEGGEEWDFLLGL